MEDLLRQAQQILRGMWLHRWLGIALAWLAGIAAAIAIFVTPDQYLASARIYVDTDSVLKPLLSGLVVQANTEQQIAILSRTLISRPNVEKLVRMADLDLNLKSAIDKESLIERVTKTLKIKGVGRDNLYTLEYLDADPERARRVVQSLTTIFVESSLGNKSSDTDSARAFINEQVSIYQKKLEDAENRLKQFKLQNIDLRLDDNKGSSDRLTEVSTQLNQARLDLREAEYSRDAIKRQMEGEVPVLLPDMPGMESSVSIPEIDGRIDAQKRNLDALLQRFTEHHPDVIGARRVIKDLEEQKRQDIAARKKATAASPVMTSLNANPAYQQMKVSLTDAEARVASLRARVAEYEARYRRSVQMIKVTPQIEAEFTQLNRDYDVHKKNYDSLIQRRESAAIAEGMSSVSGVADFRLIDPPRASQKPVAPDRLVLLPLALLASLGLGLAGSFAASQLRPTFFDSSTLMEVSGLPLLGVVSHQSTSASRHLKRKRLIRFWITLGTLVVCFAVGIAATFVLTRGI
ncbi:MAG: chain length-determining protein [Gammaproteobacteria bacterium]|nr:chain length-determining protein [Rhodocyclaceae bacterium]MBU3910122.1 chain length-determining protein [Gammaproteobacteria bacterium]MBU3990067.1 chain length-determining protein [Gammaproteobacteria bacterium]MBU4006129.1 chain length-determining protein [Gammaproteobacteria bacterium]MBU4022584.1 chain length-determining protein [Gammaproteobacteria bacterium]